MRNSKHPRPRLFCPHCGVSVAVENARYGTIKAHNQPRERGAQGPAPRCPGSVTKGLRQHPAQPGGSYA